MKLLAVVLLVLSISPCLARLGETAEESTARYGAPLSTIPTGLDCEEITYSKSGMILTERLYKGICVELTVEKKELLSSPGEPPMYSDAAELTDAEVKELLNQNAQGHEWNDGPTLSGDRNSSYYHRDDHAMAVWNFGKGLTISATVPTPYETELTKEANDKASAAAGKELHGL